MTMSPLQCKMARVALGWTGRDLAKAAQVGAATVDRFETGRSTPIPATLNAMSRALVQVQAACCASGGRSGQR
jgi:transcriptional regulator with XRE-family HTH domain